MTAPTINGTRYPQPVEALLPAARTLAAELGTLPSRNRLMREFRIGAAKADEIRDRLTAEEPPADPWEHAVPIGPDPDRTGDVPGSAPVVDPGPDTVDIPLDGDVPAAAQPPPPAVVADPDTRVRIDVDHAPEAVEPAPAVDPAGQVTTVGHPGTKITDRPAKPLPVWPVWLLMLPAFVAVWAGWVELGKLTGFGPVDLLPGFTRDDGRPLATLDTAITLPIGMETYAGYALYVWLSGRTSGRAKRFAMASALIALALGGGAQITYHLLTTPDTGAAPWQITTVVACLPVVVLGMGAALGHLVREEPAGRF